MGVVAQRAPGIQGRPGLACLGCAFTCGAIAARFDREIFVPTKPPFFIAGGSDFTSEIANVVELGYRAQLGVDASLSFTGFVQDYDRLRSLQTVAAPTTVINNGIKGQVRGLEAWGNWRPLAGSWRLDAGLLWMSSRLRVDAGVNDPVGPSGLGNDAHLQWSLSSTHAFDEHLDFRAEIRRVGRLPFPEIPSYTATNFTVNWRAREDLRFSFGVRDAFDRAHAEYQGFSSISEIPRSVFIALNLQTR